MDPYNGTTYANEYIENIEVVLKYHNVQGAVKFRLFSRCLMGALKLCKSLREESIDSWEELRIQFTTHFTTSRRQIKRVATLRLSSKEREHVRDYIERFNKEVVPVEQGSPTRSRFPQSCKIAKTTSSIHMALPLEEISNYSKTKSLLNKANNIETKTLFFMKHEKLRGKSCRKQENYLTMQNYIAAGNTS